VHAVDRLKIAERLAEQRPYYAAPLNICLQVNVAGEGRQGRRGLCRVARIGGGG